ncbi:MAG TPA: DUF4337 domain-containing protein [Terriglobales bacterium]|nr:DUF4337 domain-containing protein [Terriglobales bacterium]
MEAHELKEELERVKRPEERKIGLTMALVAVLLALATMLGHRSHTEEVLIQTKANDQWAYYQAKNVRSHMYEADSQLAAVVANGGKLAEDFHNRAGDQKRDAEEIRKKAEELENETVAASRKANQFDTAEIFLEIAIVLCSITLLTASRGFWLFSFAFSLIGVVFMARGLIGR